MQIRRLLLIDDDAEFQQFLQDRLGPNGFEIVLPPDTSNPLGHVKEVGPAIILIAVELPDKIGYALCNKAKKGLARDIPVILTTRSVPASGFRSHRKLKVHADEYIDKRAMTEDEVVSKVDQLIGLLGYTGQAQGTGRSRAAEFDELDFEELDMADLLDEASLGRVTLEQTEHADEASDSHPSAVPRQIMHDGGEESFDPRELGADADDDGSFDFADTMHVSRTELMSAARSAPVGSEARGMRADGASADAGRSPGRSDGGAVAGATVVSSALTFDAEIKSEFLEFEGDRTAVAPPSPQVRDSRPARNGGEAGASAAAPSPAQRPDLDLRFEHVAAPPPARGPDRDLRFEPVAAPPAAQRPDRDLRFEPVAAPPPARGPDLDLRFEPVIIQPREVRSGVHEHPRPVGAPPVGAAGDGNGHQLRVMELEKQVEALRAELEEARRAPFSREREFLNLRELINKKEKLILDLNDQIDDKERQMLAEKERRRELDRVRSDLDARNLELEQSLLAANEELANVGSERSSLAEQLRRQTETLSAMRADAEQLSRLLERERAQWREERDSLVRRHVATLDRQKNELQAEHAAAEAALVAQHSADLRSLKQTFEETAAERDRGFGASLALAEVRRQEELTAAQRGAEERLQLELAEQRRLHQEELEALRREQAAELEGLVRQNQEARQAFEDRHTARLARVEEEQSEALAAAEKRRATEVADTDKRRVMELAALEERRRRELTVVAEERARAEAELKEKFEGARGQMQREHAEERDTLAAWLAGRERELRERDEELSRTRDTVRARDETAAALEAILSEREARIASQLEELQELERQNAGYQEQVLRAFQKIQADEAMVARAKKAMAIALTLLDNHPEQAEGTPDEE